MPERTEEPWPGEFEVRSAVPLTENDWYEIYLSCPVCARAVYVDSGEQSLEALANVAANHLEREHPDG